jgi:hypothetical protein
LDARLAIVFCARTLFRHKFLEATKLNFGVKVIFHRKFRCCTNKHDKLLNGLITKKDLVKKKKQRKINHVRSYGKVEKLKKKL